MNLDTTICKKKIRTRENRVKPQGYMQGSDIYIYICHVIISESQHLVLCFSEVLQIFVGTVFVLYWRAHCIICSAMHSRHLLTSKVQLVFPVSPTWCVINAVSTVQCASKKNHPIIKKNYSRARNTRHAHARALLGIITITNPLISYRKILNLGLQHWFPVFVAKRKGRRLWYDPKAKARLLLGHVLCSVQRCWWVHCRAWRSCSGSKWVILSAKDDVPCQRRAVGLHVLWKGQRVLLLRPFIRDALLHLLHVVHVWCDGASPGLHFYSPRLRRLIRCRVYIEPSL